MKTNERKETFRWHRIKSVVEKVLLNDKHCALVTDVYQIQRRIFKWNKFIKVQALFICIFYILATVLACISNFSRGSKTLYRMNSIQYIPKHGEKLIQFSVLFFLHLHLLDFSEAWMIVPKHTLQYITFQSSITIHHA